MRRFHSEQRFVADAAHEILGPLTAIAGAAQVLQESAKDDPAARDRFIAHIADGTERLVSTATALLVLARAGVGRRSAAAGARPVRPLLEDVVGQNADVALECAPSVGVLADPDLLRQALATLLDNARRHARDGIAIAVAGADGTVSIDILDSGSGILPEHLERVTDRFYSAAGRDSGGYGIGLSIAARAAKVLGGTLDLASSRSGTRARLGFPRRVSSSDAGADPARRGRRRRSRTRSRTRSERGVRRGRRVDGDEAASSAFDDYDVVILDVMLPKLSGLEVCRRIRARSVVPV